MTTATATKTTARKPAVRKAAPKAAPGTVEVSPVLSAEDAAKLEAASLLATVAEIRDAWTVSSSAETEAVGVWERAKLAVLNTRVIKVRIAYRAAMVQPWQGAASIKGAARVLLSEQFGDKDADAAAVKNKSAIAAYVKAALVLEEAGFIHSTAEPTQDERDLVEPVFRATNKRPAKDTPAPAPAGDSTEESDAEGAGAPTPAEPEALTFAEVLANLARFNNALDVYTKNGGIVTQSDADTVEDIFSDISAKLSELVA